MVNKSSALGFYPKIFKVGNQGLTKDAMKKADNWAMPTNWAMPAKYLPILSNLDQG